MNVYTAKNWNEVIKRIAPYRLPDDVPCLKAGQPVYSLVPKSIQGFLQKQWPSPFFTEDLRPFLAEKYDTRRSFGIASLFMADPNCRALLNGPSAITEDFRTRMEPAIKHAFPISDKFLPSDICVFPSKEGFACCLIFYEAQDGSAANNRIENQLTVFLRRLFDLFPHADTVDIDTFEEDERTKSYASPDLLRNLKLPACRLIQIFPETFPYKEVPVMQIGNRTLYADEKTNNSLFLSFSVPLSGNNLHDFMQFLHTEVLTDRRLSFQKPMFLLHQESIMILFPRIRTLLQQTESYNEMLEKIADETDLICNYIDAWFKVSDAHTERSHYAIH